jgi:hypothetical protein
MEYNGFARFARDLREDSGAYTWFYDFVLSCVVGRNKWRQFSSERPGCTLASVSDEALALLLLENSWDCWVEKVKLTVDEGEGSSTPVMKDNNKQNRK